LCRIHMERQEGGCTERESGDGGEGMGEWNIAGGKMGG
jgi:hypothetical protein